MIDRHQNLPVITLSLVAVLSVTVVLLAWPRLHASVRYLPVDIAIDRYHDSREIPTDRLNVLIRFASEAIAKNDHYRYHDGLSVLHYLRALDPYTPALERRGAYRSSEEAARETLLRAPAQPASWLRLANIRWILHDEPETIIDPWKMSIFTGRTDASLISQRIEIALAFYEFLDDEAVSMLRDQLLLAWRLQPGSLMAVVARRDSNLFITRTLLTNTDPGALQEMEAWLERLR